VDHWGVIVNAHDVFAPPKRARKVQIPHRDGAYDYGAKNYEERILSLECLLTRETTRADFREIIYQLSQKRNITLWSEPDKYYVGELYESPDVNVWFRDKRREFTLNFICEPFAYKIVNSVPIVTGTNVIPYNGTAETPVLLILRNPNPVSVSNITITAMIERD